MSKSPTIIAILMAFSLVCNAKNDDPNLLLWYDKPGKIWEESLPLGNGRLGAMPNGGIYNETITLNEISLWSGSEEDVNNPESIKYLPQIRQLLLDGKNLEAQKIMYTSFKCKGQGSGHGHGANVPYGCFQKLGNLNINYHYPEVNVLDSVVSNYKRTLSLNNSVATTDFEIDKVHYSREYFVSHTNDVIIIKLSCDKKNALNFDVAIDREECAKIYCQDNKLFMRGQLNNGVDGRGMNKSYFTGRRDKS